MKQTRILAYSFLLMSLIIIISTNAVAQTFTLKNTVTIDYGTVWCVPVYDGTILVVSSESGGVIKAGKFDLSLNQVTSPATTVADSSDTANNDSIADHKHIFQNGYHYLVFSTAGGGQGGYLYLLKLDTDLIRIGSITTVVSDGSATNDMFLVGDGTYIYAGKFLPGTGHKVYKYDSDLNNLDTFTIGGGTNTHANGAAAVYTNNQFHLVAPFTLAPGQNDEFYRIIFDNDWNVVKNKTTILSDEGMLSIVSALSVEPNSQEFIIHYGRGSSDAGGPLYRATYDSDWNLLSNTQAIDGEWTRPHSVIVNDTLYVSYNGSSSIQLSNFIITNVPTPTPTITISVTPTSTPTATPTPSVCLITSTVVDAVTTAPIAGATITVEPGGSSVTTDAYGSFVIVLQPGTYTITASAIGYTSSSQAVTVVAGEVIVVNFVLVPAIPTPTPFVTPTAIPTFTPVCKASSITVSPTKLILSKKRSGEVTVTVTGEADCPVEGETVTAKINPAGKKLISISSTSRNTDANGQSTFTITAKKKTGKARVTLQAAGQKKSITVMVKK